MEIIIYDNQGEIVFELDTKKEDSLLKFTTEFKKYLTSEIESVTMVMEDNKTIENFSDALDNGDGRGVIKKQIFKLK